MCKIEKWLLQYDLPNLLLCGSTFNLEQAIAFIEEVIDEIDDLSDDVRPCKDIIEVSKAQYKESFPEYAEVFDTNATESEIVSNFKFDEIPFVLRKASRKSPVVITSVRKSDITGQLRFGKQYVVEGAEKNLIKIDYEHDGTGDFAVPNHVASNLFTVRTLLTNQKSLIEKDLCLRYLTY